MMTVNEQIDDCIHLILASGSALERADNINLLYANSENFSTEDDNQVMQWRREIITMAGIPDEYHVSTNILDVAIADLSKNWT